MSLERLAKLLVEYSTAVGPGERVGLIGTSASEPLLAALYQEVLRRGGHPMPLIESDRCLGLLLRQGSDAQLAFLSPLQERLIETADVLIHVELAGGSVHLAEIDSARRARYEEARRALGQRWLDRAAAGQLRWSAALDAWSVSPPELDGFTGEEFRRLLAMAMHLNAADPAAAWGDLSARQARLIDVLRHAHTLRIVTPAGTDLSLNVAGRTWINSDGHRNLPDGEVFTAPLEIGTEGVMVADLCSTYAGCQVRGVRLVVRQGQVVDAFAEVGVEVLRHVLNQDAGARTLGEVGLGCNYAIGQPLGHPLIDEKIGGTFHVALGAAYPETGGGNRSSLHWDLVGDLRHGGIVEIDGRVVSQDGRFLDPAWPE
ncbi:MAG: aminopeptidase [Gemmataceae bacterium]|nr:aminopeptidase [Gemmataceae bacterium]MDW8266315.1 aminopeptidase [Gemmataceae bacterium]